MATSGGVLVDVNVLVALAWPNHLGHSVARRWFAEHASEGWATTPVTEAGFVRVSSNRRVLPTATTVGNAGVILARMQALPGHEFWLDDVPLVTGDLEALAALTGHQQVTDAHLLALAARRSGRLATFDRGLAALPGADGRVVLLPTPEGD